MVVPAQIHCLTRKGLPSTGPVVAQHWGEDWSRTGPGLGRNLAQDWHRTGPVLGSVGSPNTGPAPEQAGALNTGTVLGQHARGARGARAAQG